MQARGLRMFDIDDRSPSIAGSVPVRYGFRKIAARGRLSREALGGFGMSGRCGVGWEHSALRLCGNALALGEAGPQEGEKLAGEGVRQRFATGGVDDADGDGGHFGVRAGEHNHLGKAHAGGEAEGEGVVSYRVCLGPRWSQRGAR